MTSTSTSANICRHLAHAAEHTPNALAVAVQKAQSNGDYRYQELDFAKLHRESDTIALGLEQYGIVKGMKAVLMVTPSVEFFSLTFALFKAGIIPILVDPGMGIKNLKQCFAESKPDAFIGITKANIARRVLKWGKSSVTKVVNVGGNGLTRLLTGGIELHEIAKLGEQANAKRAEAYQMQYLAPDELAAILFTSGSTGIPKGVEYSHSMFEGQIDTLKLDYGIKPGERDLATFPLFSLFGPALGMASIVPDMDASKPITANPAHLFAAIDKYQCSNMFVNPALLERLGQAGRGDALEKQHKLNSIQRVISAGAPATISSIEIFSRMLNDDVEVLNSYGATESLPISMIGSKALMDTTAITDNGGGICVGQPVDGVDVQIIDIHEDAIKQWDDTLSLPVNQIGEIVVSSNKVSQRYYQRVQATIDSKIEDANGRKRHRMGDVGYLDDDGKLWMCGRKAHRVDATLSLNSEELGSNGNELDSNSKQQSKRFYSIPCERVFNTLEDVKRSALVGIEVNGKTVPLICVELVKQPNCSSGKALYASLLSIAKQHEHTKGITRFLIHPDFPVDVRHNAKIFREKLSVWAQAQWKE
ncbi:AMP-binding protein [Shewanella sp. WXL01]|uniref:olefin beta-lactone synthetase n=1 Tax=Shewanella sp. WXL01 TaxID=2709721 RepID=UPI0014386996|nr:fatty acid CoA ligase family protein [Shewanella sp. WXL01]NKF50344.1 AMP-binding protein [Shewanella sp. WXL01]